MNHGSHNNQHMDQRTYPDPLQENLLVLWQFSSLGLPTLMPFFPNNRGTYLFCFILIISWAPTSQVQLFFVCNEPIWLARHKKKLKLRRLPKIENYMERMVPPPLAHLYRWKAEDFGQNIWVGLKWGAMGNSLGEHIGNLMGTWREHVGNKGKMKKTLLPRPLPKP
jgi:hypothetical protein